MNFKDLFYVFEIQYPVNPNSVAMALPHYHGKVVVGLAGVRDVYRNEEERFSLKYITDDWSEAMRYANEINC